MLLCERDLSQLLNESQNRNKYVGNLLCTGQSVRGFFLQLLGIISNMHRLKHFNGVDGDGDGDGVNVNYFGDKVTIT